MSDVQGFFAAIRGGDVAKVQSMLTEDPPLAESRNEQKQSPVLAAVYSGKTAVRDLLIAHGAHLDFHEAVAAGQLERVEYFVDKDADLARAISPDGFPVVALAAAFGHFAVVKYLFEKGADLTAAATNGTGYNALTGAVAGGREEIAIWLLENGADANYRYGPGYTPLLTAAANGHLNIVRDLLVHGADIHAKANDGKTAVSIAEERKHTDVVEFLRSNGA
ncbi:MAG TPA: ankyrin repeat domain-containing protein [Candidatus Eremiobacteraceae bacterium]|jgi:ankyrin repeat protein|nr:ankyrin repeat domain-containing protein [Candidatus Eremiobacteraceae bacterium]